MRDRLFRLRHEVVTDGRTFCDALLSWSHPKPMFGAFEIRSDAEATRRYAVTSAIALVVLSGLVGAAIAFSGGKEEEPEPDVIDVTFQAPVEEEPPPPTPEVKPEPKPQVKREGPKPPAREQAPKKIADEDIKTEDPNDFVPPTPGDGGGEMTATQDVGGLGDGLGKVAPPKVEPVKKVEKKVAKTGPVQLPENATPPKPLSGNTPPAYPDEARASGIEGEVFLKIVIHEDGSVGDIEVKKGDEPFVSAAIAVVKTWKYSPALVDGRPIAVYRIIKVPFRLRG